MKKFEKLFILAFDHRSSFTKLIGVTGSPTDEQKQTIRDFKYVIFEGFQKALDMGVPKEYAAILTDEEYGDRVVRMGISSGYTVAIPVEKSGQNEFVFDYGDQFEEHINKYRPSIIKVLIRYNPEDDQELNKRQRERLQVLSNFCKKENYSFMIEPLIPATKEQLEKVNGDETQYDLNLRPGLMVQMVKELQLDHVEPDIWKIEGLEKTSDYEDVMKQARIDGRDHVVAVVLGRGADQNQVETWLKIGAQVPGIIGFAIGRTIFGKPLKQLNGGSISKEEAINQIAKNYAHFYTVYNSSTNNT